MNTCGATTRQGSPCGRPAGAGTDHPGIGACKLHCGSTPNGRKAAQREQAKAAVVTYGLPREIDPQEALLEELHRTAGHVAWLQDAVRALADTELHGPVGSAENPEHKPHVYVGMYQQERRHFADIARTCIAVGIEERRVRIAEQQGQLIAQVIRGVLTDLGVADHPEVPNVVRRHLTLVSAA